MRGAREESEGSRREGEDGLARNEERNGEQVNWKRYTARSYTRSSLPMKRLAFPFAFMMHEIYLRNMAAVYGFAVVINAFTEGQDSKKELIARCSSHRPVRLIELLFFYAGNRISLVHRE